MMDSLNNLWRMASYYHHAYGYSRLTWEERNTRGQEITVADNFTLYSTPLNQSIVVAMDLVPKFKKDNGLQKVHTVFLTDGYSNSLDRKYVYKDEHTDSYGDFIEEGIAVESFYDGFSYKDNVDTILTDPVTKKVWKAKYKGDDYTRDTKFEYSNQTPVLLEFLKNRVPGMNVVNFFIAGKNRKGNISKSDIEAIFDISWNDTEKLKAIQKELRTKNVACSARWSKT